MDGSGVCSPAGPELTGGAFSSSGLPGGGLAHTGCSQVALDVDGVGAFTLSLWAWAAVLPVPADAHLVSKADDTVPAAYDVFLGFRAGILTGALATSQKLATVTWPGAIQAGSWTNFALSFDGTFLKLWVEGSEKAAAPLAGLLTSRLSRLWSVGCSLDGQIPSFSWPGKIDEVKMLSYFLSPSDIFSGLDDVPSSSSWAPSPSPLILPQVVALPPMQAAPQPRCGTRLKLQIFLRRGWLFPRARRSFAAPPPLRWLFFTATARGKRHHTCRRTALSPLGLRPAPCPCPAYPVFPTRLIAPWNARVDPLTHRRRRTGRGTRAFMGMWH